MADAAVGVPAGEVVTLPLDEVTVRGGQVAPASSHGLPPERVLALAEEICGLPFRGSFVGIGGADFGLGGQLSPQVAAGLPALAAALDQAIRSLAPPLP